MPHRTCRPVVRVAIVLVAALAVAWAHVGRAQDPAKPPAEAPPPAAAPVRVEPATLDFGRQRVGTSATRSLTLTATAGSVPVRHVSAAGDFSVSPDRCDLAPSSACAISVTFTPRALGPTRSAANIELPGSSVVVDLRGEGVPASLLEGATVVGLILLYFVGFATIRWHVLARPMRMNLKRRIESLDHRMQAMAADRTPTQGFQTLQALLASASQMVETKGRFSALNLFFWSRGVEMAGWSYVHDVEQQLVAYLPAEAVDAGLARAAAELRQLGTPTAIAHAECIEEARSASRVPADVRRLVDDLVAVSGTALTFGERLDVTLANPTTETCKALAADAAARLDRLEPLAQRIDDILQARREDLPAGMREDLADTLAALRADTTPARTALCQAAAAAPAATLDACKSALATARAAFSTLDPIHRRIRRLRDGADRVSVERQKALLSEALGMLYLVKDTRFATLMTWHNKTTWLMGCGLLLIAAIGLTLPNAILFLVGAAGGLLSRVSRALVGDDVPSEYGVSWVPLFLSPVMGALSAWAGILVLDLLRQWKVLGPAIDIDWSNPYHTTTLAIAFALGFAERLFDTFMSQLQDTLGKRASRVPAGPVTPPASSRRD
jgi:hypothetical protein